MRRGYPLPFLPNRELPAKKSFKKPPKRPHDLRRFLKSKYSHDREYSDTPIILAGAQGIEPLLLVLETSVLPLNYTPNISSRKIFKCAEWKRTEIHVMTMEDIMKVSPSVLKFSESGVKIKARIPTIYIKRRRRSRMNL